VSCAAALATLEVMREENLLENSRSQDAYMMSVLRELQAESPIVGDVRGIGMMIGVEFVKPNTNKQPNTEASERILRRALEAGMILYPCGHWSQTIRLIPPLNINRQQLDQGLEIFRRAVLAEKT
jgi:4-aminobutyrate aminotransferase